MQDLPHEYVVTASADTEGSVVVASGGLDAIVIRHCCSGSIKCVMAPVGSATTQIRPASGTSCG